MLRQQIILFDEVLTNIRQFLQIILLTFMAGNTSSTPAKEEQETPKVNHPRFNNPQFTRNKNDEDCIAIQIPVANEKEYSLWAKSLQSASNLDSDVFLLPRAHSFKKEGFCGSSGFAHIEYDNFPYVLVDEIRNRACLQQKLFEEPELWYLVYTLLAAGNDFHETGQKVGDIRPQNVFINQDGQVKVASRLTWPGEQDNYHKAFYEKEPTYLAPEELKDIQFGRLQPSKDQRLAESFSVGLTCLDAGTLNNSSLLYQKNKFAYEQLEARLADLQGAGYSQLLNIVIRNLCEVDPERRCSCSELFRWLKPYQESIINLERFEVSNLPQKLAYLQGGSASPSNNSSPQRAFNGVNLPQGQELRPEIQSIRHQEQEVKYYQPPQQQQSPPKLNSQPFVDGYRPAPYVQPISQLPPNVQYGGYNPPPQSYVNTTFQPDHRTYTYKSTTQTYTGAAGGHKSNMEINLDKIDEQLQMSRKMFPS